LDMIKHSIPTGTPSFEMSRDFDGPQAKAVRHAAGHKQVSGSAQYTDDIPAIAGELHVGLVLSTEAYAKIVSIDASEALKLDGVKLLVDHTHVVGVNIVGDIVQDEEVLPTTHVTCVGQPVAAIVATTERLAWEAAQLVKVSSTLFLVYN